MRKERVTRALSFQEVDRVPHYFTFTLEAEAKLKAHFGGDYPRCLDNHMRLVSSEPPGAWTEIAPDIWRDEWGVEWDRTLDKDIGVPRNRPVPGPDIRQFDPPEITEERLAHIPAFVRDNPDTFIVADVGFSLYERAWTLCGLEDFLTYLAVEPFFAHELLESIAEWNLRIVDRLLAEPGVDAIHYGDDWGTQRGLIMAPRMWREFVKSPLRRMFSRVKEGGKFLSIHSCGMVQGVFDDLVELGLDLFNPFQPEVMDVRRLHDEYFGRLAFWGGISTQKTLPYGTPDEVRAEVRDRIEMGRRGGYVLAPAHDVPRDVPLENMLAMIEAVKEQPSG